MSRCACCCNIAACLANRVVLALDGGQVLEGTVSAIAAVEVGDLVGSAISASVGLLAAVAHGFGPSTSFLRVSAIFHRLVVANAVEVLVAIFAIGRPHLLVRVPQLPGSAEGTNGGERWRGPPHAANHGEETGAALSAGS